MKKFIISALMLITITGSAFAANKDEINNVVLTSFNKTYNSAHDVKWEVLKDFIKATFVFDGQTMHAYYKPDGEQVAVSRNISASQLPINLATELRARLNESWMSSLFEVSADGATYYYATIQNANHTIILKADAAGNWVTFKKDKRDGQ